MKKILSLFLVVSIFHCFSLSGMKGYYCAQCLADDNKPFKECVYETDKVALNHPYHFQPKVIKKLCTTKKNQFLGLNLLADISGKNWLPAESAADPDIPGRKSKKRKQKTIDNTIIVENTIVDKIAYRCRTCFRTYFRLIKFEQHTKCNRPDSSESSYDIVAAKGIDNSATFLAIKKQLMNMAEQ
jgi:hypothetical protein